MSLNDLERFEKNQIQRLKSAISLVCHEEMSHEFFLNIALQRAWLSYLFTFTYDVVLNLVDKKNQNAISVVRRIIRYEYPDNCASHPCGDCPSHREDMRDDIVNMGINFDDFVLKSTASAKTMKSLCHVVDCVDRIKKFEHRDVALLSFLRFWGEVLTAVEYGEFRDRIERNLKAHNSESIFYIPHIGHDEKRVDLHKVESTLSSNSHSDELALAIIDILPASNRARHAALKDAEMAIEIATNSKVEFYSQFLP